MRRRGRKIRKVNPRRTPLRNSTTRLLQNQHPLVQRRKLSVRTRAEAARVHLHRAAARDRRPAVVRLAVLDPAEARLRKLQETRTSRHPDTVAQAARNRQLVAIGQAVAQSQQLAETGPAQLQAVAQSQQSAAIGPARLQAVAQSRQSAAIGPAQLQAAENQARQPDQLRQSSILQPAQKLVQTRAAEIPTPRRTVHSSIPAGAAISPA